MNNLTPGDFGRLVEALEAAGVPVPEDLDGPDAVDRLIDGIESWGDANALARNDDDTRAALDGATHDERAGIIEADRAARRYAARQNARQRRRT